MMSSFEKSFGRKGSDI